jgi:hypothetical protein
MRFAVSAAVAVCVIPCCAGVPCAAAGDYCSGGCVLLTLDARCAVSNMGLLTAAEQYHINTTLFPASKVE